MAGFGDRGFCQQGGEIFGAVDVEPETREVEDAPQKVLVPENSLEAAIHAIESLSDPEDIVDEG